MSVLDKVVEMKENKRKDIHPYAALADTFDHYGNDTTIMYNIVMEYKN